MMDRDPTNVGAMDRRKYGPGKLERRSTELRVLYYEKGLTQIEIAIAMGVTQRAVSLFMKRHGLKARPQIKRDQRGAKNSTWRGDAVTYKAAHQRVYAVRGRPMICEMCGTGDQARCYEWANMTGRYHDPSDYKRMCKSCHNKHDGISRNFKGATGGRRAYRSD